MQPNLFTIGRLSGEAGVNIETIRYYERIGLLPAPPRTTSGRRLYDRTSVQRLGFVRRARELGFSIDEIRALLAMAGGGERCKDVRALTVRHLDDVRAKIADLQRLERTLSKAAALCRGAKSAPCPIIEALASNGGARAKLN